MKTSESYTTQVPLSSTTGNILLGTTLQTAPATGFYKVIGRHAAAAGTVVLTAFRGSDRVLNNRLMQAAAGGPNMLEDELGRFSVKKGDSIVITLTETAGTATNPAIVTEFQSL